MSHLPKTVLNLSAWAVVGGPLESTLFSLTQVSTGEAVLDVGEDAQALGLAVVADRGPVGEVLDAEGPQRPGH